MVNGSQTDVCVAFIFDQNPTDPAFNDNSHMAWYLHNSSAKKKR